MSTSSDDSAVKPWAGPGSPASPPKPSTSRGMILAAVIVVVVIIVVAVFVTLFVLPKHRSPPASGSSGTLLVPQGEAFPVVGGQSATNAFVLTAPGTLQGSFSTTYGINVYVLTNDQVRLYAHNGTVPVYEWSSGFVTSGNIDASIPAGTWNLAFINLHAQASSVLITTNITYSTS